MNQTVILLGKNVHLTVINAGHNHSIVVKKDKLVPIMIPSSPLGVDLELECDLREIKLERGETLMLYTDGLTENYGPSGKPIRPRHLQQRLGFGLSVEELKFTVLDLMGEVWQGGGDQDDCTFMFVKWKGYD